MAKIHGKNAVAFIKEYKVAGDANRLAMAFSVDTVEVTGFEEKAKQHIEGRYTWTASMEGFWNSASGKIDERVQQLIGAGSQVVGIFPSGTMPSRVGYEGFGILTSYNPEATIGGAVVFSADWQGDSHLHRSTILNAGVKTGGTVTSTAYNLGSAGLNRGISAVLRALGNPIGTCDVTIQAGTIEAGNYGDIFSFTQLTGGSAIEYKNIATAAVGPWFRSVHKIIGETDSFDLTISCATKD